MNTLVKQPNKYLLLFTLAGMTMFMAMCTDMYLPGFTSVAAALHVHVDSLQLTFTSFTFGVGLGQIFYGPISDRFGRRNPAIFGIILFVLSSLLCASAKTLGVLVFYRFLQAIGGAAGMVISRAVVRDRFSGIEMAKMMSAMSMIFVFSPAVAPTLGAAILRFGNWPWIFIALALFGILIFIGVMLIGESLPPEKRNDHGIAQSIKNYREIVKNPDFRGAATISAAGSFVTFAYVSSSASVLMGSYGVSRAKYGYLFALIAIGLIASNRANLSLVHKVGVMKMLGGFTIIQSISTLGILVTSIFHGSMWLLLFFVVICFGCAPGMNGNSMTIGMHPFPEKAASAAALLGLVQMFSASAVTALLTAIPGNLEIKMGVAMFLGALASLIQVRRMKMVTL